ncbi:MAG: HlyC/CorC family transporter [Deltaproteobacteria bacterium]|nr:MAG: HlyC/CorC family transporter [Deltaproteobacteria bacterium]
MNTSEKEAREETVDVLVLLVILFSMSAFFSGSETAFFSVPLARLNSLRETSPSTYERIARLRSDPKRLIITVLIGGEIANISISSIFTSLFSRLMEQGSEVTSLIVSTCAILMFGDLIPKSIAFVHGINYVRVASFPLTFFMKVITPVRFVVEKISSGILYLFGVREPSEFLYFSESKFRTLVDEGEKSGEVDRAESRLIHNIFELSDKVARDAMTPVNDVFMVEKGISFGELLRLMKIYRHSRIPVYEGSRNNVVGILYFKDILKHAKEKGGDVDWLGYVREPYFVPETKSLSDLLNEMQRRKIHMSVVISEYGTVSGIVTMEDILEELFGEIRDEYDVEEKLVIPIDERTKIVSAKLPVDEFNRIFGVSIDDDEFDTVGGLVLHLFGHLPKRGEKVKFGNLEFTVERVQGIRIHEVRVRTLGGGKSGN